MTNASPARQSHNQRHERASLRILEPTRRANGPMPEASKVEIASQAERSINPGAVLDLYAAEQWWPERTLSEVTAVLLTGPAVGAWTADRLVGFARAVTDGHFRAYVEDVVVAPDVRRAGVGSLLVTRLLELIPPTAVTTLFCRRHLTDFYAGHGFHQTSQLVMHRQTDS